MKKATRRKEHKVADRTKSLMAASLAQKIGYLRIEDFHSKSFFELLSTQPYSPHKIIQCSNQLLLVRRGLVEIWHPRRDLLVKSLPVGALFGDMPALGQTMVVTQAIAGEVGATVAVIDADRVKDLLRGNLDLFTRLIGPRLAASEVQQYRSHFQRIDSRIAALLLELAGEGSTVQGYTHSQLGDKIGLIRESLTNVLQALKADKLIQTHRKGITLLNKKALQELSEL